MQINLILAILPSKEHFPPLVFSAPPCTESMWGVALSPLASQAVSSLFSRGTAAQIKWSESFLPHVIPYRLYKNTHRSRELPVESSDWGVQETWRYDAKENLAYWEWIHSWTWWYYSSFPNSRNHSHDVRSLPHLSTDQAQCVLVVKSPGHFLQTLLVWLSPLIEAALCLQVHCHLMHSSPESPKSILQNCRGGLKNRVVICLTLFKNILISVLLGAVFNVLHTCDS